VNLFFLVLGPVSRGQVVDPNCGGSSIKSENLNPAIAAVIASIHNPN
jgi:hypothetical protein